MLTILPQEGQCGIPARKKLKVGRKNRLSATSGESGGGRFLLQAQGGEGKAGRVGGENSVSDSVFEQANSLLFRTAGNAHEETHDFGHGAEGIHVIVVKAEAKIGVGQTRVESLGAQKVIAGAHAEAGGI